MSFQSADMGGISSRRLRYAVAASLLLHVLLLWPDPLQAPVKEGRSLLQATMRTSQALAVPELPKPPSPRAPTSAPKPSAAPPAPAALPLEAPRQVSVPPALKSPAEAAAIVAPAAVAANPPAAAGTAIPQTVVVAGNPLQTVPAPGESPDGLRGYRLAVASQARRFKRYPAEARASGWTGSTEVRLEVGAEGLPRPATVVRSSGYEALDRAALAMIDAGAQRARLPDNLRGRGFAVLLPVVFNLDEE